MLACLRIVRIALVAVFLLVLCSCNRAPQGAATSPAVPPPNFDIHISKPGCRVEIPIEIVGGMSVIRCRINGKPARMHLDTACGGAAIYEDKVPELGLTVVGTTPRGYTAAGELNHPAVSDFVIEFSEEIRVTAQNTPMLPKYTDASDVYGIIGNPILMTLKANIDYTRNILVLNGPRQSEQIQF